MHDGYSEHTEHIQEALAGCRAKERSEKWKS
jgi:hypothetical protein